MNTDCTNNMINYLLKDRKPTKAIHSSTSYKIKWLRSAINMPKPLRYIKTCCTYKNNLLIIVRWT